MDSTTKKVNECIASQGYTEYQIIGLSLLAWSVIMMTIMIRMACLTTNHKKTFTKKTTYAADIGACQYHLEIQISEMKQALLLSDAKKSKDPRKQNNHVQKPKPTVKGHHLHISDQNRQ